MIGRWRAIAAVAASCLAVRLATERDARAHDLRPGVLALAETGDGTYALRFTPPVDSRGDDVAVAIELPPGCARDGDRVRCDGALAGRLAVRGMRGASMRTIVRVERRDGGSAEWVLSADEPEAVLGARPPAIGSAGAETDHTHGLGDVARLAFLLGVLLVAREATRRRSTRGLYLAGYYALGGCAAWWLIERVLVVAGGGT